MLHDGTRVHVLVVMFQSIVLLIEFIGTQAIMSVEYLQQILKLQLIHRICIEISIDYIYYIYILYTIYILYNIYIIYNIYMMNIWNYLNCSYNIIEII